MKNETKGKKFTIGLMGTVHRFYTGGPREPYPEIRLTLSVFHFSIQMAAAVVFIVSQIGPIALLLVDHL